MFDDLTGRLGGIFDKLKRRGALKKADVEEAMREVRVALLEADVALEVVKDFITRVTEDAVGERVLSSVTPGQMVVKAVYDHLIETLGTEDGSINLQGIPPVAILMVGLQGSGKTTTSAKLGLRLQKREKKKVLMASLDVFRPAAQQQLIQLGEQTGVQTLAPGPDKGYGYVGPAGAGHFVKMVHNGIEYGMMQAYAEGFELMQAKEEF
ncbi:MAG: signal recognition particle receptor subunit alpha, partial [Proteobacteria bacterium]|nr:signal recognition particle receptor subunit alpha [Pseudomonadota bacterium]